MYSGWYHSAFKSIALHVRCVDVEIALCSLLPRQELNMSNPPNDPFYSSPFGPFYRRHSPYMVQPEYRIYEMNKRLQSRTEVSSAQYRTLCNGTGFRQRTGLPRYLKVLGCLFSGINVCVFGSAQWFNLESGHICKYRCVHVAHVPNLPSTVCHSLY